MKKLSILLMALCLSATSLLANNVLVSGVSVNGQNTTAHYSMINFNISWDHSWRTGTNENNYDGTWVFIKFRKANSGLWQHATMNYVLPGSAAACGHTEPVGSTVRTPADGKGVWMYRSTNGSGNVVYNGASLRWNYGADGVLDNDSVEIRVYALEMVYVTQGLFSLGSGGTENNFFKTGTTTVPYIVTSENAITVGTSAGNLNYATGSYGGDALGPIPAGYPKGYNAFWIMKYEVSQQQYVDFLNALDAAKANARNVGFAGTPNNFVSSFPERASGSMSGLDHLAILDWAALRPFTELEYEKACRGYNIAPVANEFAWGNTTLVSTISVYNAGTTNETEVEGNCTYYNPSGYLNRPIRCGAWAKDTTTTRTETGGSYYGALELSGNLQEFAVTAGSPSGRTFTGVHGDGYLDPNGEANVLNWSVSAMGLRGSGFNELPAYLRVSDRYYANYINAGSRVAQNGGRGVRTAE